MARRFPPTRTWQFGRCRGEPATMCSDRKTEPRTLDEQRVGIDLRPLGVLHQEPELDLVAARGRGRDRHLPLGLHARRRVLLQRLYLLARVPVGIGRPDLDGQRTGQVGGALDPEVDLLVFSRALHRPPRRLHLALRRSRGEVLLLARGSGVRISLLPLLGLLLRRSVLQEDLKRIHGVGSESLRPCSIVDVDVGRTLDDGARRAAMLRLIVHPREGLAVDVHRRRAALDGEGVRSAADGVDPEIILARRRLAVDEHIRRAGDDGTDGGMRTGGTPVRIRVDLRLVSETGRGWHPDPPAGLRISPCTAAGQGRAVRGTPGGSICKPGDVLVESGTKLVAATDELKANSTVLGDMDYVSERRLSRPSDRNGEFKIDDAPGGGK